MAPYNKFNIFVEDFSNAKHDLFGTAGSTADTTKVMLSNTAPVATNAVKADITEIAAGNGYSAGGSSCAGSGTRSTATFTLNGTNVTWTASGGTIGPFQYVVHYNDTQTTPAKPLINWWDYGSALTLQNGDSFTVKFNNGASNGTIFDLA